MIPKSYTVLPKRIKPAAVSQRTIIYSLNRNAETLCPPRNKLRTPNLKSANPCPWILGPKLHFLVRTAMASQRVAVVCELSVRRADRARRNHNIVTTLFKPYVEGLSATSQVQGKAGPGVFTDARDTSAQRPQRP